MAAKQHNEHEGVIKYQLDYRPAAAPAVPAELDGWRSLLYRLRLLGQDPGRYEGLGYGNVSCRAGAGFIISGTQTGARAQLGAAGYVQVEDCDPAHNRLRAVGPVRPSSEALTHGMLYALDARINAVLHVHCPELWQAAQRLGIPATRPEVPYGTPAMANEMQRLFQETAAAELGILVMAGHEDGVIAFGADAAAAGCVLLSQLARAYSHYPETGAAASS